MAPSCLHNRVQLDVSSHAAETDFTRPPLAKRHGATTKSGRAPAPGAGIEFDETLFPGPLVLPDDALAIDSEEPPQSLRSWTQEKMRNPLTSRRKTIYVGPFPEIAPGLSPVQAWAVPALLKGSSKKHCDPPKINDVCKYLEAFYHPLPVKLLPEEVRFVPWTGDKTNKKQPEYIGLQVGDGVTRITTRPCPDENFTRQLNLNDIIDAAMGALPDDAYALVMLTYHDLYEDDDDDFCCGRAYGNSRVAVVSSSRYHPALDDDAGIDRTHMWPASHCAEYVETLCRDAAPEPTETKPKTKRRKLTQPQENTSTTDNNASSPMHTIMQTAAGPSRNNNLNNNLTGLWLSRLARTVSHELGHCFCLAHCSYYACVMQGTAGLAEDTRQPPYLCLVCLAKLTRAIRDVERGRGDGPGEEREWVIERYQALARFCEGWKGVGMFDGLRCWAGKRVEELEAREG